MITGPLRYISSRLVEHEPAPWWSRLTLRGKAGIPSGASVEGELAPAITNTKRAIERYERLQRDKGRVQPVERLNAGPWSPFFEFEGRGAELFTAEAYWVAMMIETTAVLLVGSITHVVGGPAQPLRSDVISPSVQPDYVAQALLQSTYSVDPWADDERVDEEARWREYEDSLKHEDTELKGSRYVYDYVWNAVMSEALENTPLEGLRTLGGVAENRGPRYFRQESDFAKVSDFILGVPLYVEVR